MQDPNKPAGAPTDFKFETPEEREARLLRAQSMNDAEMEFRREQDLLDRQRKAHEAERKKIQSQTERPKNSLWLIVGKKPVKDQASVFSVVGLYSSVETLTEHLCDASDKYNAAGHGLGVVEFDLSLCKDQPVVPPQ